MAAFPALEVRSSNAQLDVTALASVISTAEESQEIEGQRVQVVVGRPVGSNKQSKFFVGNVPIRPPRADAWGSPFLNVPVFEPPAIDASPVAIICCDLERHVFNAEHTDPKVAEALRATHWFDLREWTTTGPGAGA